MKKFFTSIIVLSISFFLLIEFIGDRLIKNILEDNVSSSLGRKVTIEKLNIDYLSGAADAKGINLLNKEFQGYLVRINSVKVNLDALSIFSNNILINDVQLKDISVNYYLIFLINGVPIISDNYRKIFQTKLQVHNQINILISEILMPKIFRYQYYRKN